MCYYYVNIISMCYIEASVTVCLYSTDHHKDDDAGAETLDGADLITIFLCSVTFYFFYVVLLCSFIIYLINYLFIN